MAYPTLANFSAKLLEDFKTWVEKTDPNPHKYREARRETLYTLAIAQQGVMEAKDVAATRTNPNR